MAIVNSKDKKVPTAEVITNALADMKRDNLLPENMPLQAIILSIIQECHMPDTSTVQLGNTVFISHFSKDRKEIAMRAFNIDTPRNYLDNSIQFAKQIMKFGVERMTSDFADSRIAQLFTMMGRRKELAGASMQLAKLSNGATRAYVRLPKR